MRTHFVSLVLLLAPALAAAAAGPLERNLGPGLTYFRLHVLPADLPVAPGRRGASIVDLRFTVDEPGATAALGDWLKSHCAIATPVFVLLNGDTAPAVLAYFGDHSAMAGLVTLGTPSPGFTPDIIVKIASAVERTAYDALDKGTAVESLLADRMDKPRHDEAAIAQERTAPVGDDTASDTDLADPAKNAPATPTAPPPVTDYTLLRAVQLHQALVALRKL